MTDFVQHSTGKKKNQIAYTACTNHQLTQNIAPTMSEFMQTLEKAAQAIRQEPQLIASADKPKNQHKAAIAILAGVDLFMRFVTRNSHDFSVNQKIQHV